MSEEKKFSIGDHVRMLPSGQLAVISEVRVGSKYVTYGVVFMGHTMWGSADAYELAPAPASETGDGAADWDDEHGGDYDDDSGYSELIDEMSGRIKSLERENATMIRELAMLEGERNRLRQQLAAATAALLECTTQMNNHGNDDNWETVTMAYAQAIKDGRAVLEATE